MDLTSYYAGLLVGLFIGISFGLAIAPSLYRKYGKRSLKV